MRQADAALRARLQAPQLLERVPAGLQPPQRVAGDGPDRGDRASGGAHRGRRARGRRADPARPGSRSSTRATCRPSRCAAATGSSSAEWWDANRFQAYEGVSVPGFPNMFMILGPYGFNGASYFTLIENQARHIVRCLRRARSTGSTSVEVTREANRRYFEKMLARRDRQVFFSGTCATANSYYFDTTATPRSAPHRRSRSPGAAPTSTSTTTGSPAFRCALCTLWVHRAHRKPVSAYLAGPCSNSSINLARQNSHCLLLRSSPGWRVSRRARPRAAAAAISTRRSKSGRSAWSGRGGGRSSRVWRSSSRSTPTRASRSSGSVRASVQRSRAAW